MSTINTYKGTVEAKVHSIASTFTDCDYIFADFAQANVAFDNITKPTIMYVLPAGGKYTIKNDEIKESPQTQIWFLCPSEFDFDGEENDCRVEAMKRVGIRFIRELNKSGLFEYIDEIDYQVTYDAYDVNLTGVCFTPKLKEKQGILLCESGITRKNWDVLS